MAEHTQAPGPVTVLRKYFGQKPGQTIVDFKKEMDELTQEEKLSLAQQAAKQLGLKKSEVSFELN